MCGGYVDNYPLIYLFFYLFHSSVAFHTFYWHIFLLSINTLAIFSTIMCGIE